MINLLFIYSGRHFQKIYLPTISEQHFAFILEKEVHGFSDNITIHMEALDGCWCFSRGEQYGIYKGNDLFILKKPDSGDCLKLKTTFNDEALIVTGEQKESLFVARKFVLNRKLKTINGGRAEDNDIVIGTSVLVSKHHISIVFENKQWVLYDKSHNGTYINGKRVHDYAVLHYGDSIEMFGCELLFLGELLAVLNSEQEVYVNQKKLVHLDNETLKWMSMVSVVDIDDNYEQEFTSSPRFIAAYNTEDFEIEAPPAPRVQKERSLFMTLGPSVTMIIPMLIGALFTGLGILSIGLFTMVGSALIGGFWAYMNNRNQKKTDENDEEERFTKYKQYLKSKETELERRYNYNCEEMRKMYPDAETCSGYTSDNDQLWNRNSRQDDYLFVRLGEGNELSPFSIRIPEQRFTLIDDTLAEEPARIKERFVWMKDVPVGTDLSRQKMIGVVGGQNLTGVYQIFRNIAVQLASGISYLNVKFVLITDGSRREDKILLEDLKWLPHIWDDHKSFRYACDTRESLSELTEVLLPLLKRRREADDEKDFDVQYVFFVSSVNLLEGSQLSSILLDPTIQCGTTTLIGAATVNQLPNACEYIIENTNHFKGDYHVTDARESWRDIRFDEVSDEKVNVFAHRIASVRFQAVEEQMGIPDKFTIMEMYHAGNTDDLRIQERWKKSKSYETLRVPIGIENGGRLCFLDAHEHAHGPHGLVAGTSGSGKSEMLQSWILSLAVNFSPEDVAFFLVDFKGGGMANQFQNLPHLAGAVTNLSENQIYRALVSIRSENQRRQRIFAATGRTDIDIYKYTKMYKNREVSEPLPHLFIIVDEFAELKKDHPEFINELISVSRIGRSLGVHLVLATQTPAGTVDDNIDKNTRFRICLRVSDEQGSRDMLKRPDAAYITNTGRAYLRVGYDEVFEQFQSAWSGAEYKSLMEDTQQDVAKLYTVCGRPEIIGSYRRQLMKEQSVKNNVARLIEVMNNVLEKEHTSVRLYIADKDVLKRINSKLYRQFLLSGINLLPSVYNDNRLMDLITVYDACVSGGYTATPEKVIEMAKRMGKTLPEIKSGTQLMAVIDAIEKITEKENIQVENHLWIPELPENLYLRDVSESVRYSNGVWKPAGTTWTLEACVGKYDNPERQYQAKTVIDFANFGNYAVYGSVGSGKSIFLQTMVYSLLTGYTPEELNLYCLDFSSRMLECFRDAPHVGGLLFEDNKDEIGKFFFMIRNIMKERRKMLTGGNFSQYRMNGHHDLSAIVIVIDQYGVFREKTETKYDTDILEIAKEGNSLGIYLVVSAGGTGSGEVPSKLADNIKNAVCLQMNDKYAYKELLKPEKIAIYPRNGVKGRGLWNVYGEALEFQTALCLAEKNDYQRSGYIKQICSEMKQNWNGKEAIRIPIIPDHPIYSEFVQLEETQKLLQEDRYLPLGYAVTSASVWSLNLSQMFCYIVSGKKRSGKKNFLEMVVKIGALKGARLIVFGKEENLLARITRDVKAEYYGPEDDITQFCINFKPELIRRNRKKKDLECRGLSDEEIYGGMKDEQAVYIIIEDLSSFIEKLYNPKPGCADLSGFFETFTDKGWYHQIFIFAGINQDEKGNVDGRKVYENIIRDRNGIHFGGNVASQHILNFDYLSYKQQTEIEPTGIGQLAMGDGRMQRGKVVVPLAIR